MSKAKEDFEKQCFELLSMMYESSLDNPQTIERGGFIANQYNDKVICFNNKHNYDRKLDSLIESLLDFKDWGENISSEYLKSKINKFLIDCFSTKKEERHIYINKFYENLKKEFGCGLVEYTVPLLIENLSFNSEIMVGDVKFIHYSSENCEKLLEKNSFKAYVPDTYQPIPKDIEKNLERTRQVRSIGIVKVTSVDFFKAIEKANEKVEEALNVIRLFRANSCFGVFGRHNRPMFHEVIAIDNITGIIQSSRGLEGDISECKFSADELSESAKKAFENICEILKEKRSRENMENKLLIAINIFGEIQKSVEKQHNISKIFTALETLLIFDKSEFKGGNIAERAVLINHTGKENRIKKRKLISEMYKFRNELVHQGSTDFKSSQYDALLIELHLCILNIAKHIDKYHKKEDWKKIIEEAKEVVFEAKLIFQ